MQTTPTLSSQHVSRPAYSVDFVDMDDGAHVAVYAWPDAACAPRAVVQIAHGLAEHAGRYDRLARALNQAGYLVYASDHRGHGRTAHGPSELGFFADHDGFARVVRDVFAVTRHIETLQPGLPKILLGHSFGSFVAQAYLFEHGQGLAAAVLSGTASVPAWLSRAMRAVAYAERLRLGPRAKSRLLQQLSFGAYNRAFEPVRTPFDWLSRDPDEVDKYLHDPLCGFDTCVQGWIDVSGGLGQIARRELQARIPKDLPIYILSGALDPVGDASKGPARLAAQYRRVGLRNVTQRVYPGARHELFNETNRDEVTSDLVAWLDSQIAAP